MAENFTGTLNCVGSNSSVDILYKRFMVIFPNSSGQPIRRCFFFPKLLSHCFKPETRIGIRLETRFELLKNLCNFFPRNYFAAFISVVGRWKISFIFPRGMVEKYIKYLFRRPHILAYTFPGIAMHLRMLIFWNQRNRIF